MPLSLDSRFCGKVYIIRGRGRIVAGEEVKSLETAFDLAMREFTRLVLHMGEVDRLDSTGMGLLVRYVASTRKRGGDLRLAAPPSFVVTLLQVTKLASVIAIHPTEEDAIVSFLKESASEKAQEKLGPRVLFLDGSGDLCAFVRTVLTQHGFDVKSTCLFRDAKTLLQVDAVDYILLGPGTARQTPETVLAALRTLAPKAKVLHLGADFHFRDAHEAAEVLLQVFKGDSAATA